MKRSEIKRKTPLRSTSTLQVSKPMARGGARMRASKPKSEKPKRAARAGDERYLAMCRGQRCWLLVPGVSYHNPETVVPCHSNSLARGKGMGMKAPHEFTVPGCMVCHQEIDQGALLTKEERADIWESAYEKWSAYREIL